MVVVWNFVVRISRVIRRLVVWVCVWRSVIGRVDVELCVVYVGVVGDGCFSLLDLVVFWGVEGYIVF